MHPRIAFLLLLGVAAGLTLCMADAVDPINALSMNKLARNCKFSSWVSNDDYCNRRVPGGTAAVEVTCDSKGFITGLSFSYVLHCSFKDLTEPLLELQKLRTLNFFRCGVKGALDPAWGNLQQLRTLSIVDMDVSGKLPDSFGMLKNLVSLTIGGTKCCLGSLEGQLPRSLGNLKKLQHLSFSFIKLSSMLPKEWGYMESLKTMQMNVNMGLYGTIPEQWKRLTNLEELSLAQNKLEGSIPGALAQLPNLKKMDLSNNPHMCGPVPGKMDKAIQAGTRTGTTRLGTSCDKNQR